MALEMRSEKAQKEIITKKMVDIFIDKGFKNIRADLEGFETPYLGLNVESLLIRPNITCIKDNHDNTVILLKAVTCDSLLDIKMERKLLMLHRMALQSNAEFHVAVPKFCMGKSGAGLVERKLKKLNILADVKIWTPI